MDIFLDEDKDVAGGAGGADDALGEGGEDEDESEDLDSWELEADLEE